jgi:hypothetical protein
MAFVQHRLHFSKPINRFHGRFLKLKAQIKLRLNKRLRLTQALVQETLSVNKTADYRSEYFDKNRVKKFSSPRSSFD